MTVPYAKRLQEAVQGAFGNAAFAARAAQLQALVKPRAEGPSGEVMPYTCQYPSNGGKIQLEPPFQLIDHVAQMHRAIDKVAGQ